MLKVFYDLQSRENISTLKEISQKNNNNLIEIQNFFEDEKKCFVVMEYCSSITLQSRFSKNFDFPEAVFFFFMN
jgi:serine/threonine protein kinase